jgi:hypothetical protein
MLGGEVYIIPNNSPPHQKKKEMVFCKNIFIRLSLRQKSEKYNPKTKTAHSLF